VVASRRTANLVISTGIVAILLLSFFTMYRMYLRAGRLREKEQEFVVSISHELRTPITVIRSASSNLAQGVVHGDEKVGKYGTIIQEQAERLSRMVEGILTCAGLSSGNKVTESEIEVKAFFHELVKSIEPAAKKAGAEISVDVNNVPEKIITCAMTLRLVTVNLLLNAIRDVLPEEEDLLHYWSLIRLFITCKNSSILVIQVEDCASGITEKETEEIFEPFVRGGRAVAGQKAGSGQ